MDNDENFEKYAKLFHFEKDMIGYRWLKDFEDAARADERAKILDSKWGSIRPEYEARIALKSRLVTLDEVEGLLKPAMAEMEAFHPIRKWDSKQVAILYSKILQKLSAMKEAK